MHVNNEFNICLQIGDTIEVFWPNDNLYYPGIITGIDKKAKMYRIVYDDGDIEVISLNKETWRHIDKPQMKKATPRKLTKAPKPIRKRRQAVVIPSNNNEKIGKVEDAVTLLSHIFTSWLRREKRCHLETNADDIVALAIRNAVDQTTFAAANGDKDLYRFPEGAANTSWLRNAHKFGVGEAVRRNYRHWTIPLSDSEWEVEKSALCCLAYRIENAKGKVTKKILDTSILFAIALLFVAK